jgi:hypothetical protein
MEIFQLSICLDRYFIYFHNVDSPIIAKLQCFVHGTAARDYLVSGFFSDLFPHGPQNYTHFLYIIKFQILKDK